MTLLEYICIGCIFLVIALLAIVSFIYPAEKDSDCTMMLLPVGKVSILHCIKNN